MPTLIDVNLSFNPIHNTPLGWFEQESVIDFATPTYPYSALLEGSSTQFVDSQGTGTYVAYTTEPPAPPQDDGVQLLSPEDALTEDLGVPSELEVIIEDLVSLQPDEESNGDAGTNGQSNNPPSIGSGYKKKWY